MQYPTLSWWINWLSSRAMLKIWPRIVWRKILQMDSLSECTKKMWVKLSASGRKVLLQTSEAGISNFISIWILDNYSLWPQVVDGTPCDLKDGIPRICVDGECRMIGCDGLLGSVVLEDKCRICGGDGANCKTISGILDNSVSIFGENSSFKNRNKNDFRIFNLVTMMFYSYPKEQQTLGSLRLKLFYSILVWNPSISLRVLCSLK